MKKRKKSQVFFIFGALFLLAAIALEVFVVRPNELQALRSAGSTGQNNYQLIHDRPRWCYWSSLILAGGCWIAGIVKQRRGD